jgi:hypothetical protein
MQKEFDPHLSKIKEEHAELLVQAEAHAAEKQNLHTTMEKHF